MNDTIGAEGIVPTVLVFGEYPPVYIPSEDRRELHTASRISSFAHEARIEVSKLMTASRIARALKHITSMSADETLSPGDKELVWREKIHNNRIGELFWDPT